MDLLLELHDLHVVDRELEHEPQSQVTLVLFLFKRFYQFHEHHYFLISYSLCTFLRPFKNRKPKHFRTIILIYLLTWLFRLFDWTKMHLVWSRLILGKFIWISNQGFTFLKPPFDLCHHSFNATKLCWIRQNSKPLDLGIFSLLDVREQKLFILKILVCHFLSNLAAVRKHKFSKCKVKIYFFFIFLFKLAKEYLKEI